MCAVAKDSLQILWDANVRRCNRLSKLVHCVPTRCRPIWPRCSFMFSLTLNRGSKAARTAGGVNEKGGSGGRLISQTEHTLARSSRSSIVEFLSFSSLLLFRV